MSIYRVSVTNTKLTGENREYIVQAKNIGDAENKALRAMYKELAKGRAGPDDPVPGTNYAYAAELLGDLVK